jgi:ArsR family transcriptional regulator
MQSHLTILAALAEPTRFAAMRLLRDGRERCLCDLMESLGKSQSGLSRHMTALKKAGLVVDRRDAQWVRYRRNPALSASVRALIEAALRLDVSSTRKKTS